jgi:hypothetical protein
MIVLDRAVAGRCLTRLFIGAAQSSELGREGWEVIGDIQVRPKGDIVEIQGLPVRADRTRASRDVRVNCGRPIAAFPGIRHRPRYGWPHPVGCREGGDAADGGSRSAAQRLAFDLVLRAQSTRWRSGAYLAARAKGRDREMKFLGIERAARTRRRPTGGRPAAGLEATFV